MYFEEEIAVPQSEDPWSAGLDITTSIDFSKSLEERIAAARCDWGGEVIAAIQARGENTGVKWFRNRLFFCKRNFSSGEALERVMRNGFLLGDQFDGLAVVAAVPRLGNIVCLGSSSRVNDARDVVCFDRNGDNRGVLLLDWAGKWTSIWAVLGSKEIRAPGVGLLRSSTTPVWI